MLIVGCSSAPTCTPPSYDSNGGGASSVASLHNSACTPSAEAPSSFGQLFGHCAGNLRNRFGGDGQLHRAHFGHIVAAAEHHADDLLHVGFRKAHDDLRAKRRDFARRLRVRCRRCESSLRGRYAMRRSLPKAVRPTGRARCRPRPAWSRRVVAYRAFVNRPRSLTLVRLARPSDLC